MMTLFIISLLVISKIILIVSVVINHNKTLLLTRTMTQLDRTVWTVIMYAISSIQDVCWGARGCACMHAYACVRV